MSRVALLKERLGLDTTLLGDAAFKVDLNESDFRIVLISLLDAIAAETGEGGAGSEERVIAIDAHSSGFTVPAGKQSIALIFSEDFVGTVDGTPFDGANDSTIGLTAPRGDTLGALIVAVTEGSVRVATTT